jgi:hypothetical protein
MPSLLVCVPFDMGLYNKPFCAAAIRAAVEKNKYRAHSIDSDLPI